ncbi:MAG: sulfur oxidation c-type cytochrome SoxA [Bradyrhizobium sp.]
MRLVHTIAAAGLLLAIGFAIPRLCATEIPQAERRSGYTFMSPDTKAIQDDDTANPGMLWVLDGEALWKRKNRHGGQGLRRLPRRHQRQHEGLSRRAIPPTTRRSDAPSILNSALISAARKTRRRRRCPYESRDLLALTAFVAQQSRGMPITAGADLQLEPFVAKGRDTFMRRQGQLNLGCTNCHDDNWDKHLAGSAVTQALPTGYPLYRLEWQSLGSLQRRLRNCMTGMRTQLYDYGAPELVELELYLMSRAHDMPIETPAVRP